MSDKIRILIVDDIPETRENVRKLLQFESDLDVIAHAASGEEAVEMTKQHQPDVVLMDINMPDADGISASQMITQSVPGSQVIIMSVQSEADYLRRAMVAGARDFLMKPFSGDELVDAVRRVYETRPIVPTNTPSRLASANHLPGQSILAQREGKVISIFSPKGGAGCTTVAVNTAVGLAAKNFDTLLLDGSLQFGDVAVMLNIKSLSTIVDIIERIAELDQDLISSVVTVHESGLKVLLAPPRPEMAEVVKADDMKKLLQNLRQMFDFIVVDTSSSLNDVNIALLDEADQIVLLTQQDLPSLKNISRFFDLSEDLEYQRSKVKLVVNHSSSRLNITVKDIENTLKWPATAVIPEDDAAYWAADQGRPLVLGTWRRRPSARALALLTNKLMKELEREGEQEEAIESNGTSRLARLFGK